MPTDMQIDSIITALGCASPQHLGICTGKPRGTRGRTRTRTWQKPVPAMRVRVFCGYRTLRPVPVPAEGIPTGINTKDIDYSTKIHVDVYY
jgi:hypothetical protein